MAHARLPCPSINSPQYPMEMIDLLEIRITIYAWSLQRERQWPTRNTRLTNNIDMGILRRLFRGDFTDDRIGTDISIDNRSPCSLSLPSRSHVSRASSSPRPCPARECQETPLLAARNSSLVHPRIIARVNGSFFSMLRLVHTEYVASQRQFHMCATIVSFVCLARYLSRLIPKKRARTSRRCAILRFTPSNYKILCKAARILRENEAVRYICGF